MAPQCSRDLVTGDWEAQEIEETRKGRRTLQNELVHHTFPYRISARLVDHSANRLAPVWFEVFSLCINVLSLDRRRRPPVTSYAQESQAKESPAEAGRAEVMQQGDSMVSEFL